MISRFGKESASYRRTKELFYNPGANEYYLKERRRLDSLYRRQPPRKSCKNCDGPIAGVSFTVLDVDFVICRRCGHLNGVHQDTPEFCRAVYSEANHAAQIYGDKNIDAYLKRVDTIYKPKIEFLLEALKDEGSDPTALGYADLGAGSGHLVAAMLRSGLERARGYEVSSEQVALGNTMLGRQALEGVGLDKTVDVAATVQADVVTMVFSLEHFERPRDILRALKNNRSIRYLMVAVPLFSPATAVESAFPAVMPRQLGLGHTHLYTESSLNWLYREFGLRPIGEWWFGSDAFDIHRTIAVALAKADPGGTLVERWSEMFLPVLDELQFAFDRRKLSSEVHVVLAKDGLDSGTGAPSSPP